MKKEVQIKLRGDATKNGNKIILTSGLHSTGEMTINLPITPTEIGWTCKFTVQITEPEGISDGDGQGGDGIKMKLCAADDNQEFFAVSLDTFQNIENNSGNEVVVYLEGTKVAQAPCNHRFNDGEEKQVEVVYLHHLETVVVRVDDMSVVAYAFHDLPFYSLVDRPFMLCFSSFTGDAGGKHAISNIEFTVSK